MIRLACLAAIASFAAAGYAVRAEHGHPPACHDCQIRCPRCHCCVPSVDVEKIKEHCWEIDCEPVCIPRVTFPWERKHCPTPCGELHCPPAKCGKVRYIHVLRLVEYECQMCKYTWTPICKPPCDGGCQPQGFVPYRPAPPAAPLELPTAPRSTLPRQASRLWLYER